MKKNMSKKAACVLFSGGVESSCVLVDALSRYDHVYPIYIQKGFIWEKQELASAKALLRLWKNTKLKPLCMLRVPLKDTYGKHWALGRGAVPGSRSRDERMYLPGRNLLFLSKAAVFCALNHIPAIEIGVLSSNPFSDASGKFLKSFSSVLSEALSFKIHIRMPLIDKSKSEAIRQFRHLNLERTFSCVSPRRGLHCGCCNKCAERKSGFKKANVIDATRYAL